MEIIINGVKIEIGFTIGSFSEVVTFMKFYEPEKRMTIAKYLGLINDDDYVLDVVCDLIYYPYALREKRKGTQPAIGYEDVFTCILSSPEKVKELSAMIAESMPKPEKKSEPVQVAKRVKK